MKFGDIILFGDIIDLYMFYKFYIFSLNARYLLALIFMNDSALFIIEILVQRVINTYSRICGNILPAD